MKSAVQARSCPSKGAPLSPAQCDFVESVRRGESCLLLGQAGVGKSACLNALGARVQLTATTGVASTCLDRAVTLFKFLGLRPPPNTETETFGYYWNLTRSSMSTLSRLCELTALVVDEVSMLHGRFLLILDLLLRAARGVKDLPFGGVQMILVGDFLQLPPVVTREDPWKQLLAFEVFHMIGFFPRRFDLLQVFRQQEDPVFLDAMREARNGHVCEQTLRYLRSCEKTVFQDDGLKATVVFQTNRSVDAENNRCMCEAPDTGDTRRVLYKTHGLFARARFNRQTRQTEYTPEIDTASRGPEALKKLREHFEDMELDMLVRTDMQVLFRVNVDPEGAAVANGTSGVVVGWMLSSVMGAVAVTLVELSAAEVSSVTVKRDPSGFPTGSALVPVVRVTRTGRFFAVHPHTSAIAWPSASAADDGRVLLARRLPFVAGWALTIHRIQGATLDRVDLRIELAAGRQPPPGAYYVVLSRVRDKASLRISGTLEASHLWNSKTVLAHFGDHAAQQAFGHLWHAPPLAPEHVAHTAYAAWTTEACNATTPAVLVGIARRIAPAYQPSRAGCWRDVSHEPRTRELARAKAEAAEAVAAEAEAERKKMPRAEKKRPRASKLGGAAQKRWR